MEAIISALTGEKIWNVAGRVRGIPLGNSRFQIDFDSERDLQKILKRRPCHFSKWSFALERWEPHVGDVFPNTMTFWVNTEGIPSQFWLEETFQDFGKALGVVRAVDAPMARFQVTIKADEPLRFRKKTQLPSGEVVWVSLRYEKLHRWCKICHRICHEEEFCPLNPETQAKLSKLVSGLKSTLGNQPPAAQSKQAMPLSAPAPNGKGTTHPSWWRPDLAPSPPKAEKSRVDDFRRTKAEGKRIVGNSSSSVWERLERRQSGPRETSSKTRYHDTRNRRDYPPDPPSLNARKEGPIGRSNGAYNRPYKPQGLPLKRLSPTSQGIGRKRRFEDSFDPRSRKLPPFNEKTSVPLPRHKKMSRDLSMPQIPPQISDSQATMSDPHVTSLRAKQALPSPELTRARPFRLNLSQSQSPRKKSWYEQTLEEEEEAVANGDPRCLLANQIPKVAYGEDKSTCILENSDEAIRIPETDEIEEEGDDEVNQNDLEEHERAWMRNKAKRGCVNLNWTEEDEAALQEDEISLFNTGDPMEDDDLLGDEIEDLQAEESSLPKKIAPSRAATIERTKGMGMGRPKAKDKKKREAPKKPLPPKAQSDQSEIHKAASKKLHNFKKRSSPKQTNSNPVSAKPKPRISKAAASGPGKSVFPSSSKSRALPPFDSTGGSKQPPGTTK